MSINVAKLVAKNLVKFGKPIGVKPAILIKVTGGVRTPGSISAGVNPTTTSFTCSGLVAEFSAYEIANSLAQVGDRKVILFGATISNGTVVPSPGDRIVIGGETMTIVENGVRSDPVKATHECRCRD